LEIAMTRKGLLATSVFLLLAVANVKTAAAEEATSIPMKASTESALVPWTSPVGGGVSFGYENGLWGSAWVQGLRVKVPFQSRFGMAMRPLALQQVGGGAPYRADLGGRVELYGATPVFLNFARIYGGGGPQLFYAVTGLAGSKPIFGGGGHFGFEFFMNQHTSFFAEIGGASGAQHGLGTGGTAMAGVTWYPWGSKDDASVAAENGISAAR
jgi:hypothetical protein